VQAPQFRNTELFTDERSRCRAGGSALSESFAVELTLYAWCDAICLARLFTMRPTTSHAVASHPSRLAACSGRRSGIDRRRSPFRVADRNPRRKQRR